MRREPSTPLSPLQAETSGGRGRTGRPSLAGGLPPRLDVMGVGDEPGQDQLEDGLLAVMGVGEVTVHRPGQVSWGGTVGSTTPCVAGDLRKGPGLQDTDGQPVNGAAVYEIHTMHPQGRLDSALRVVRHV